MNFFTDNFITILTTLFGGGGTLMYVLERKKNKAITKGVEADVESKEIDNGSKVIDLYKSALDDLEVRCEKKYLEMEKLYNAQNKILKEENAALEKAYQRKVKLLEDENKLKNKIIVSLRREIKERDAQIKKLNVAIKNANNNS